MVLFCPSSRPYTLFTRLKNNFLTRKIQLKKTHRFQLQKKNFFIKKTFSVSPQNFLKKSYFRMLRSFARSSQIFRLSRAASAESELILERLSGDDKGIAVISFNRPKAMNSFSKNMVKCMRQAIDGQFFLSLFLLVFHSSFQTSNSTPNCAPSSCAAPPPKRFAPAPI